MKTYFFVLALTTFSSLYGFDGVPTYLQNLSLAGPNGNIQLAVSANGKAIAVWTNWPNQGAELQAAFFDGKAWLHLINTTSTINSEIRNFFLRDVNGSGTFARGSSPKVGIDQEGNATIVWVSPNNQIIAARYTGPFLNNVTQLTDTGTSNISPTLAVNQQGLAVVVWIRAASYQVQARSFNPAPGGGWSNTALQPAIFMPIPFPSINTNDVNSIQRQNIPASPNGTYPAGLGLSDIGKEEPNQGTMVWIDGPSGAVRAGNFAIP